MPNRCLGCGVILDEASGGVHVCPHAPPSVRQRVEEIRLEARRVMSDLTLRADIDRLHRRIDGVSRASIEQIATRAAEVAIAKRSWINPALLNMSDEDLEAESLASGLLVPEPTQGGR